MRLDRTCWILPVAVAVLGIAGVAWAVVPPALAPLAFLLGEWQGVGTGKPGASGGDATFARAVQGTVIVRTSYATYPATAERPAFRHDDLMVVYAEGGQARADYWDNEGHVIRYRVTSPSERVAVFESEPSPSAPRFRLTYTLQDDGTAKGQFEMAPPGKPDAFSPYLSWIMARTKPAAK